MNGEDAMTSPIEQLHQWIVSAPFGVAPKKAQVLFQFLISKDVKFEYAEDSKFLFESSSTKDEGIVRVSVPSLELLWAAAYSYWKIYQLVCSVQRRGDAAWTDSEQKQRCEIEDLYSWALINVARRTREPWPAGLPLPGKAMVPESDEHVATEIFLVALGWILHHEIGHILHGHSWDERQRAKPKRDREWEADAEANRWLFEDVESGAVRQKLALAVATAIGMLATGYPPGVDSDSKDEHPHPLERLVRSLGTSASPPNDVAYAYAISALQMNMLFTNFTYVPLSETASFREQLEDLCTVIRTNKRGSLWAVISSSDLPEYWRQRISAFDHKETQKLAYSRWEARGRPLWSAETDWYQAEKTLLERRIDPATQARIGQ